MKTRKLLICIVLLGVFVAGGMIGAAADVMTADAPAFLRAPEVITNPGCDHLPASRRHQAAPSLTISPQGRLWATWDAGTTPGEDRNNYVVVSTSGDGGKTWTETVIIDPDGKGPVRAFAPELWVDPKGRLWSFWAQTVGHNATVAGVWAMTNDDPDKGDSAWSPPRRLTDGIMMCKPTVLSSGEWVLPASTWRKTDNSARVVVSTDKGQTWCLRGACHVPRQDRDYDEHMIVERKDESLWMLVRTRCGIGESISKDRGRTWPALSPSLIQHPAARFFIRCLASGKLLLVKHADGVDDRRKMTAYLSDDDGRTWSGGLLLDERGVSYPDRIQAKDGTIYINYDYRPGDGSIRMAVFTEQDVAAGKDVSGKVRFRILVSPGIVDK